MRERDLIAARAPFGRRCAATEEGQSALAGAIGVHDVDLLAARTVALEHDLAAIGRIGSADVDTGRIGQPDAFAAAGGYAVDIGVAAHGHRIENPAPVGAPARRKGRIAALADQRLPAGTDVVDIDARIAVDIAEVDQLLVIG